MNTVDAVFSRVPGMNIFPPVRQHRNY